jgi:hypothetical protein
MRRCLLRFAFGMALSLFALAPAVGADGPFTVAGVHVDASASSTAEARNAAIAAGRVQAWQILFRRITRQQDWGRQPALSPDQLQKYISGYFPTSEKRSTTRYVAEVTYIFSHDAVARLMQSAKIAYALAPTRRILVVAMAPAYARSSGWAAALANPRLADGMIAFSVPFGDAQDMAFLGGLSFASASWSDVAAVAVRKGCAEVVLIQAVPAGDKMTIALRRLGPNQIPLKGAAEVAMQQGGATSTYALAADLAVRTMEDMWKSHAAVDFSRKDRIAVHMRIASLARFAALQGQLAGVSNVADVSVSAMNTGGAQLSLSYQGSIDQLQDALAQAGFSLVREGQTWWLAQGRARGEGKP